MRYLAPSSLVLFCILLIALVSGQLRLATIGDIVEGSAAYRAGFRSGDEVTRIEDREITSWESFCIEWAKMTGLRGVIAVRRADQEISISLEKVPDGSPSEFGLNPFSVPAALPLKISSPLRTYGVSEGDELKKLNGVAIGGFGHFVETLSNQKVGVPLNMDFIRREDGQSYAIGVPGLESDQAHTLESLGIVHPVNVAKAVRPGSLAAKLGVMANDRFILIQGQAADPEFKVAKFNSALRNDRILKVAVVRGDKVQHLEMKAEDLSSPESGDLSQFMNFMGISPLSKVRAQNRWPGSFAELKLALLFQLIGKE